jgi:GntR family transcriptional repressor for pyruvate dehydrogenase complex
MVMAGSMFTPVRTRRTFEEALDQITERITVGDLQVGDRLPPEREMAAQLDISRPTLREALKVLSQAGIIEVRSRSGGTVIRSDLIPQEVISRRSEVVLEEVEDVLEVRRAIETDIALIAATRATGSDFDAIRATIDAQRAAPHADVASHLQLDERFHLLVARATRNPMFVGIVRTILGRLAIARDMTPQAQGDTVLEVEIHARTLRALESRDPALIEAAMDEHMSYLETVWARAIGPRPRQPDLLPGA